VLLGVTLLVGIIALCAWQPLWAVAALERASPQIVWRVPSAAGRRVALSFDDGPLPGGLMRPRQARLARERGYACVLGSAYPYDPSRPPSGYIRWLVEKNMEPGAIIILHDGIGDASGTVAALDHILDAAASRGLAVVPVGELLAEVE
jgi:peptidoglycan/xylan/chitin deacetylase (PgdA/CDA1 family)